MSFRQTVEGNIVWIRGTPPATLAGYVRDPLNAMLFRPASDANIEPNSEEMKRLGEQHLAIKQALDRFYAPITGCSPCQKSSRWRGVLSAWDSVGRPRDFNG